MGRLGANLSGLAYSMQNTHLRLPTNRVRLPPLFKEQNKPLYAFLQTTDSGLSLSYELLKEKFNKSIFPAGAAFFTVLFFFR